MGLDAQEAGGSLVHMEGAQVSKIQSIPVESMVSRTGPTVGNDDEGEIERRGDYQTSEGVDERVDCES